MRFLEIGQPLHDVEAGSREPPRVGATALQDHPKDIFEVGRFLAPSAGTVASPSRRRASRLADERARGGTRETRVPRYGRIRMSSAPRIRAPCSTRRPRDEWSVAAGGRHVEIDPLEELAAARRVDERHLLHGPRLQRHAAQSGRVSLTQRALTAVVRQFRSRRQAVLIARTVRTQKRFVEQFDFRRGADLREAGEPDERVRGEFGRYRPGVGDERVDRRLAEPPFLADDRSAAAASIAHTRNRAERLIVSGR